MSKRRPSPRASIDSFSLEPGSKLANKYEVVSLLGAGWEGEVYKVKEQRTGIERAAKFFFPQRNLANKTLKFYAQKLHKLRDVNGLIKYHTQETIDFRELPITFLVSDYYEGEQLKEFLDRQPGKRLRTFEALHLLHAIAETVERIHANGEYHGDIHLENVMVLRKGLGFEIKLLDMIHWATPKRENIQDDICDAIKVFYDAIGGKRFYSNEKQEVKDIVCGLRRTTILKKFRTMNHLLLHLNNLTWS